MAGMFIIDIQKCQKAGYSRPGHIYRVVLYSQIIRHIARLLVRSHSKVCSC